MSNNPTSYNDSQTFKTRDLEDSSTSTVYMTSSSSSSPSTKVLTSSISSSTQILTSSSSSSSTQILTSSLSSSSQSSLSSSSQSSQSSSSSSSTSSNFGFLETPWDLVLSSIDPIAKTIVINWKWTTQNHWGDYVTPTGFIVERQIEGGTYELVTYEVEPNSPPTVEDYTYTDTLNSNQAAQVFAYGYQLRYRVRAYWITP